MVQKSDFGTKNEELDTIFAALANRHKRAVILFIGEKGRVKGGHKTFTEPLCQEYPELDLKPYTIAPKLSGMRYTDHLVKQDSEGYWVLTELGKKAYDVVKGYFL
jgi:hypothetical protein